MSKNDAKLLADRYVAIWNEPDPGVRHRTVRELWTEDGVHLLEPPQEAREAAAKLAIDALFEARGHDALEARVARAYDEFVASGQFVFRPRDDAKRLGDVVKFHWEALDQNGEAFGVGLNFLVLAADGRIERDYVFVVA
jgi:hypothetical protein